MADGRRPHNGVKIPGHIAMVFPPRNITSTVYGTYDQQLEAAGGAGRNAQSPLPLLPSPNPGRVRLTPPRGGHRGRGGRGSRPTHPRGQGPTQRPVQFPRGDRARPNQGSFVANNNRPALVKPPQPAVMMWEDLKDFAEQLTGWESDDEECGKAGSVRLVGKIAGDEYNLDELLETVAEAMDADPRAIALVDHVKLTDLLRYDRDLERENRRLRRQLREAGLEPRV
ncbi:hypothetical protein VTL71DRAFT_2238 [Oculimacula yallundae]|uniref:Uncharacterized protein n=1 Tax=Oculimacula yallundae TaxID=86028 RepID=A0ABR4C9I2_9HELO